MRLLEQILEHNLDFVEKEEYKQYQTTKFPDKKLVVLSCMDTRLMELLHKAMNMKHGDMKIVKNAGAIVSHPFGSIMRSILVAVYELNADEVAVVGHHDCGMGKVNFDSIREKMEARGIKKETIDDLKYAGIDVRGFLKGFDSVEESVRESVDMIVKHPLMPKGIPVHGLVIDPHTGKLDLVTNGYEN
ncbi:beta-class carbonic anhydrase [Sutcliffiella rhizosphaerae]|uniref:carbonic anhydrase n=1 Tax=Sutcliffiella rhizosphaerae TaxID=2880967 RepID=A0ABN8AH56_9BACI|nr:carbonic anhydrase [Sutcliffiella rhizosphaerae]CAG9622418.1 Beta-carbonic anhydrase 1 [Sutcliffiella rhizosphaerae]